MTWLRRTLLAGLGLGAVALSATLGFDAWVRATDLPPLSVETSTVVLDREGRLLRAFTARDGRWRLPVDPGDVDPRYLAQLIAYEDKRFYRHSGVDPLALLRAVAQAARTGRVVSGGSTLSMQVARLLEEGSTGRWSGKLRQIRLALAMERRLSKQDILKLYLTRAPFGGNLEGVRAASLSYFGKEPTRLTPAEVALLIALPQAPEARRPDRAPEAARLARDRVLARLEAAGVLPTEAVVAARHAAVPTARQPFPTLAAHLAGSVRAANPETNVHVLSIDRRLQIALEELVRTHLARLDPRLSAALIVADHRTGAVLARIGSAGYLDERRDGFIDMSRAIRSPGSTLKPLIYGLAFDAGIAHPETLIEDRPMDFGGYAPQNFDQQFLGTLSLREALQRSRNLPAVALLEAVGPAHLIAGMQRAGVQARLPRGSVPGLAIGLGGVGVSLEEMVELYAAMANEGRAVRLRHRLDAPAAPTRQRVISPAAAWYLADILRGAPVPTNVMPGQVAFKTGTSYGYRDAFAFGFDGAHVIGVWIGRADAGPIPGALGLDLAAPLMFAAFGHVAPRRTPLRAAPAGALLMSNAELPAPQRRFGRMPSGPGSTGPVLVYPPQGARVDLGLARGAAQALSIRLQDGVPPFVWIADGQPIPTEPHARSAIWYPDGPGFVNISVIDAEGRAARTMVFVE